MHVGINHAPQFDLIYTLIIQVLCMIPNDILQDPPFKKKLIFKYIDLGRRMIKMCIPHTLIDLGPID